MTWVKFHPISLPHPLWSREPRLDLPLDLGEYHGKFGDVSSYRKQMHKEQIRKIRKFSAVFQKMGVSPTLPRARRPRLDLPPDLRICHGKFGDASSYRDQMHKEQTDRQTDILLYIDR